MAEDSLTNAGWFRKNRDWLVVALFATIVFFARSWEGDLDNDAIHYAAVAKNIVTTGTWGFLQDQPGEPFVNKPPLMMWLVAMNFKLFGVSTYAAKFWSCAFGVGVAVMVCLLGRRLFNPVAGILAGCFVATMRDFVRNTVDLRLESAMIFMAVLSVYAVVRAIQDGRARWLILPGIAAGVGIMIKAISPVHVFAPTVLVLAIWRPRWLLNGWLFGGLGLGLLIAAPWHLYMWAYASSDTVRTAFTQGYVGREIGGRLSLSGHFFRNLWEGSVALDVDALPWWPLAAYALIRLKRTTHEAKMGTVLALIWIAEVLIVMAIPPQRYDRYALPAFPAIALLAGYVAARLIPVRHLPAIPRWVLRFAICAALVTLLVPIPLHAYKNKGYVTARPFIDRFEPGDSIAYYNGDGKPVAPRRMSSKTIYFLDRKAVQYASLDELLARNPRFVITNKSLVSALEERGYRNLMPLDKDFALTFKD